MLLLRYGRSLEDYEKAIRLDPEVNGVSRLADQLATAFATRGDAATALDRRWAAIKEYDYAIRANPEYALAYRNRGAAYRQLRLLGAAGKDFDTAVLLDPRDTKARAYQDIIHTELIKRQRATQGVHQPFP